MWSCDIISEHCHHQSIFLRQWNLLILRQLVSTVINVCLYDLCSHDSYTCMMHRIKDDSIECSTGQTRSATVSLSCINLLWNGGFNPHIYIIYIYITEWSSLLWNFLIVKTVNQYQTWLYLDRGYPATVLSGWGIVSGWSWVCFCHCVLIRSRPWSLTMNNRCDPQPRRLLLSTKQNIFLLFWSQNAKFCKTNLKLTRDVNILCVY